MQATIVDLRYKMKEVLKALERKEPVTIVCHGKEKGLIVPSGSHGESLCQASSTNNGIWGLRRRFVTSAKTSLKNKPRLGAAPVPGLTRMPCLPRVVCS